MRLFYFILFYSILFYFILFFGLSLTSVVFSMEIGPLTGGVRGEITVLGIAIVHDRYCLV